MHCDVCNRPAPENNGVTLLVSEFRQLLSKGWGISESNVAMLVDSGIPREQAIELLKAQYATSQSPWRLCPTCAAQASMILAGRASAERVQTVNKSVTVHMRSPITNYTVEHWVVGEQITAEHYEKFKDTESGALYAMTTYRGGQPELHLLQKGLWSETKSSLRM